MECWTIGNKRNYENCLFSERIFVRFTMIERSDSTNPKSAI